VRSHKVTFNFGLSDILALKGLKKTKKKILGGKYMGGIHPGDFLGEIGRGELTVGGDSPGEFSGHPD